MMEGLVGAWRRNWRRATVLLFALVVLIVATRTVYAWWIDRQLRVEVARLEKAYRSLNTHSMNPPTVPDSENRARVVRAAAELVAIDRTDKAGWYLSGWSALKDCLGGVDCPTAVTGSMRQFVEQNKLAVHVAVQGRTLTGSTWGLNYRRAETTNVPRNVVTLNTLLAAACRVELEDGALDRALEVSLSGLAAAASMRNEWTRLMQVWRMDAVYQQAGCVREMLRRAEPSAHALSDLAAALADSRWPDPTRMSLIGELKITNAWFMELERGREVAYLWGTSSGSAGPINWLLRPVASHNRLSDLRALGRYLQLQALEPYRRDAAGMPLPAPSQEELRKVREWEVSRPSLLKALRTTFVTPWLSNEIDAGWEFHSVLNAAEAAVALRRYRLDHGSYPNALSQLVPRYLTWVPTDPFTGRPLEYAKDAGGFQLHAQGANGRNGGYVQGLFDWIVQR